MHCKSPLLRPIWRRPSHLWSMSFVKPLSDMKSEIERALTDIGAVTKTFVEAIVENRHTKWTNTLESHNDEADGFTFKNALRASYFNSNNYFKPVWLNAIE